MKKRSVFENYIYNVIYQILVIITPLITTPYISRILKADGIGAYSYTYSIVYYFTLVAGLGLSMYGQREVAYHQNNIKERSKIFFEVELFRIMTVGFAIICYLYFLTFINNEQYKVLFQIQTISIVSVLFDVSWFFQGMEEFRKTILRNLFVKIIGVVCIFIFIHKKSDLSLYTLILVGTVFIGNISLWFYLPKYIIFCRLKELQPFRNIKTIFELFIPMMATSVYNVLDKTMIGLITSSNIENGYYEQTTKIVAVTMAILTSLGVVLLPRMANSYVQGKKNEFKNLADISYRFIMWASCPICFGIISISSNLVPWFLGNEFNKVSLLLKIYAIVVLFIPLSNIAGAAILTPTRRQNKGSFAVLIGALVNFSFNLILIRYYNSLGAAIATIVAEFIVTLIHFFFIRNDVNLYSLFVFWIKHILASILMAIAIILITKLFYLAYPISDILMNIIQIVFGIFIYIVISLYFLHDGSLLNKIINMINNKE